MICRQNFLSKRRAPGAFTLVEVLVALAVISILAGIALPTLKSSLREQKVSRAASLLQSAIEEGRARSIGRGGGGGVIIDRIGSATLLERAQAIRIRMAAAPPNYNGDVPSSTARFRVVQHPTDPSRDLYYLLFHRDEVQMTRSALDARNGVPSLINEGDAIYLGEASYPMRIQSTVAGTPAIRDVVSAGAQATTAVWGLTPSPLTYPAPLTDKFTQVQVVPIERNVNFRRMHWTDLSYSIDKQPRPAIALPVELPKGSAIDLTASGMGRFGNQFSPMEVMPFQTSPTYVQGNYVDTTRSPFVDRPDPLPANNTYDFHSIWVLFGMRGEVSRLFYSTYNGTNVVLTEQPVTGDIHFLVGRAGEVKVDPAGQLEDNYSNLNEDPLADERRDGTTPLLDSGSIWVTIKASTGEVIASNWVDPTDNATDLVDRLPTAPPPAPNVASNNLQRTRVRDVIRRVRTGAVESRDGGSL